MVVWVTTSHGSDEAPRRLLVVAAVGRSITVLGSPWSRFCSEVVGVGAAPHENAPVDSLSPRKVFSARLKFAFGAKRN